MTITTTTATKKEQEEQQQQQQQQQKQQQQSPSQGLTSRRASPALDSTKLNCIRQQCEQLAASRYVKVYEPYVVVVVYCRDLYQ